MIDDVVLKRFDAPDETRVFDKGRFEIVRLGGMTLGRATMFYIAPGHDSWVVGDEPYVSLHLLGGDEYARAK